MALGVDIISAFDGAGIKKAIEEFKKLETNGQRAQFAIQKAALPAAAALAGLAAAAGLAVKAAVADQQEQAKLAQTLKQVTGASAGAIKQNEEYLASLQRTTIFSDSEMRPALANLVQASGDLARSQRDLTLAMDISVATGVPLAQVTDALGKAYNGNMKSLQALSPALKDNIKEGQNLEQIFTELNATFGGATAAATDTAAGQMAMLKNQLGELVESFGTALLPIVQAIVPVFSSLANFAEDNRTAFLALAGIVAAFAAAIVAASAAVKIHTLYQNLMKIELLANSVAFRAAGTAAIGFGSALAGLVIAETLAPVINDLTGATAGAEKAFKNTGAALDEFNNGAANSEEVLTEFINTAQAELKKFKPLEQLKADLTLKNFGREFQLIAGDIKLDIEIMDKTFKGFADKSPAYAQSIVDAMKAQLLITDPTSRAYKDLQDAIARYESQLRTAKAAQDALNGAVANTPKVVAFTGALARLESQTRREFQAREASAGALDTWNSKANAAFDAARSGAGTVQTATERLSAYTAALRSNYDAQRSLTAATNSRIAAEKSLTVANEATKKAQEQFNKVVKGYARDSKEAVDATRRFEDAQRRLRDANISQRNAVRELREAEDDLRKLREQVSDPENVADAERNLERAKYAVEEANFALAESEAELAAIRQDPSASLVKVRRAEIALAEAKIRVSESVNSVKEAEKRLAKETDPVALAEKIADAEDRLERAKNGVEDAANSVRDATVEQETAQANLNTVLEGAAENTEAYEKALLDLVTAKEAEDEVRRQVAGAIIAEADATFALADAQKTLAATGKTTPKNLVNKATAALAGVSTANPALAALNQISGQPAASTTTMNVTVNAGMGTDGQGVAREIIDILKQYERANGFIPLVAESTAY